MAKIDITARLNAASVDGILASANQIYDENKGKFQTAVNEDLDKRLNEQDGRLERYHDDLVDEVNREVAETIETTQETIDQLKEASEWLKNDPSGAQAIMEQTNQNTANIATIGRNTGLDEYSQFSTGMDYSAGDVVLYDGVLFRFKADHAKGEWDYNEVEEWSEKKEREELGLYVSNPEYARAYTDAEGRFLWGIKQDGSIEFAKGVPTPIKEYIHSIDRNNDEEIERINNLLIGLTNEVASIKSNVTGLTDTYHYISNKEWIMAVTDSESRILIGLKADGSIHIPNRELFYKTSNEEYLQVVVDNNNNILFGIRADGSIYIPKGISDEAKKGLVELTLRISILEGLYDLEHNPEYISVTTDKDGRILEGIDSKGEKFFSKQALFNKYNDAEDRLEIVVDANNKVISYRDKDGVLNEYKINTREFASEHLNLTNGNAVEIQDALRRAGVTFQTPNDFSEKTNIEIPIPRVCASARILVPKMPTTKTADIEGYLEYYDKDGNYFKKAIILNSQGSSSMGYIRPDGSQGNLSVDFADCKIKFGNWVAQDSFHIKKYYIDAFRGQCVVGYHLMEQVYQTHPYGEKKPYDTIIQNGSVTDSLGKFKKDYNTGALCHPDGFPVVIYVNTGGEDIFYGVYAWCLKKHRDNYYCDKANPDNIILDGVITKSTLFGGQIDWTQFEIRNPKDLVDINGNEYDGDNPKELSNTDELSAAVKNNIVRLSGVVDAMTANNSKETFEQYFLPKYFIDYYIISQVIYNVDGFHKNWIWCTWDGQHWTPTLYDVDSIFGMMPIGTYVNGASANTELLGEVVTSYLTQFYSDEIKERYHELRDKGVFSVDNIVGLLESWIKRIGYQNLKDDLERFNQTPSYRKSYLNDEVWELVSYSWNTSNNDYDKDKTYNVGDTCYFYGYLMKAKIQNIGLAPFSQIYSNHPQASGFYNSLARVKNWLTERISFLDSSYNYTNL